MAPSDRPDPRGRADGREAVEDRDDEAHALVRAAASRLYAEAPADFIATRTALVKEAKAAGAKDAAQEIGALRKPSVAAWFLNQVAHAQHPVIAELADLGARLRQATSKLDAAAITSMRGERDAVLTDLVRAVHEVADDQGQSISASVEAEVRDTGIAALADEAAEEVLRSGTMTRALAYAGFGEVDLSQAAATTSTGVVLTSIPGGRKKSDRAEHARQASDEPAEDETSDAMDEDDAETEAEALDDGEESEEQPGADDEDEDDAEADSDPANAEPEAEADDEPNPDDEDDDAEEVDDGAEALAEAAAEEERERRIAQAEQAVDSASREIGRRRAALDAARNRSEATRQRIQKLEAQLERARADDDDALDKVSQAVAAAKRADADLKAAHATLADLSEQAKRG